ncbi:MAG: CapA family protein [Muribaculaceae bacterium]|nr:CapA family protein [Muribaculaceae bacterium]
MALIPLITFLGMLLGLNDVEIAFAGDAMQHQAQLDAARRPGGAWDYSECFAGVAPWFKTVDFAVVNLETPIGPAPHSGYPCFNAPEPYLHALRDAGFDLFLTANNHTLDRRDRGLRHTVDALDSNGLAHIGTYRDTAARDSLMPHLREVNGIRIGFLNYTYGTNGIEPRDGAVVDLIDRTLMAADIQAARRAGAEIVCVCVHWGDEYKLLPNAAQRSLADWLQGMGVELIIGSHPHVVQPMELRDNPDGSRCLVVYSLGNLISNMRTRDTRGGAAVTVRLERRPDGKVRVADAGWQLHFTEPAANGRNFRVVDAYESDDPRAAAFREAAEAIFRKHNRGVERISPARWMFGN